MSAEGVIIALSIGVPIGIGILGLIWIYYRVLRPSLPVDDILGAYKIAKLKEGIKKRGMNFNEMMGDYYKMVEVIKTAKKGKGWLNDIDARIDGELDVSEKKK